MSSHDTSLIDCDVHQMWKHPSEITDRLPDHYQYRGYDVPQNPWPSPVGLMRDDARPERGMAGSDPELMAEQLLDPYDVEYAICNATGMLSLGVIPNADYATELARAYNDWLVETWLDYDDRFRGALAVAPQDPERAAEEVDRLGGEEGIVQVQLSSVGGNPYGERQYWPIFEAAERHGLPVGIHIGPEGFGTSHPHTPAGYPQTYFERHTLTSTSVMGHLVSTTLNGVFQQFPDLNLVLMEGGFSWLPYFLWRLDKDWKGLRRQTPWLDCPPSEVIKEHVRFTTQPLPEPGSEDLLSMFDLIDAERTLLFSSDYPHWDADDPRQAFPEMDDHLRRRIFAENARELYDL